MFTYGLLLLKCTSVIQKFCVGQKNMFTYRLLVLKFTSLLKKFLCRVKEHVHFQITGA
jgi:hypothetical protein